MKEKLITKSFERLLDKGKNRGFITYEELGKSLGKRGGSLDNTEKAFLIIADNKVTLVQKKSEFQPIKKRENVSSSDEKGSDKSDDPIRMYLREMGGVELLSREGEIAIAKRIEAGKDVMINALTQSPIVGKKIFEPQKMRILLKKKNKAKIRVKKPKIKKKKFKLITRMMNLIYPWQKWRKKLNQKFF